jgi:hypothetical protein
MKKFKPGDRVELNDCIFTKKWVGFRGTVVRILTSNGVEVRFDKPLNVHEDPHQGIFSSYQLNLKEGYFKRRPHGHQNQQKD